jgi:hypothetical protein
MSNIWDAANPEEIAELAAEGAAARAEQQLNTWQDKAAQQYPQVEHLKEYLSGASENAVMELARDMAAKMQGQASGEPTAVHVPAGSPGVDTTAPVGGEYRSARSQQLIRAMRENPEGYAPDGRRLMAHFLDEKFREAGMA